MEIIFDMPFRKIVQKNNAWEVLLRETCEAVLKSGIDADEYTEAVLDEMHMGEAYQSPDGTPYYYEIPAIDTANGHPVVVRL